MPPRRRGWTLAIVSVGLFMVVLDNLVVSVALPSIHRDLGASIQSLEWTVNAYVLSYAVLLLTGAALGDRFGRRRMFMAGIALFTVVLGGGGAGARHRPADRRPRAAGRRRGDRHAADADAAGRRLPAGPPRRRASASGRASAASPSRSARSSAARSSRPPPGTGSSGSTCPIGARAGAAGRGAPGRELRPVRRSSTCRAWRWARPACSGSSSGSIRSPDAGLDQHRGPRLAGRRRRCCWSPSSSRSCARASRCCRWRSSPAAASRSPTSSRCRCTSGCSARSSS